MKKTFLLALLAAISLCAQAQKGRSAIGGGFQGSYIPDEEARYGFTLKYQYHISNRTRIEPSFSYLTSSAHNEEINFNIHYLIGKSRRVRPFIGIGFGVGFGKTCYNDRYYQYNGHSYDYEEYLNETRLLINPIAGLDIRLSHSLSMQIEATPSITPTAYSMLELRFGLGITYGF